MANKGALVLRVHMECKNHKKAVRGEMSLAKVSSFFTALGRKSNDAVLAAEGAFAFHTITS